ncbi:hypothetical protein AX760_25230 [Pararhizobium antarcticum]|uniref:Uncharacterized protein n=1 Tax=Pararhizobium antarcticum TaxID=1798805 RepID=A0A657LYQ6_9HYPH|nr:hypothetical protein AX761_15700 [Rhizobium sp. 58]OJG00673.1 hypothetical protein AX760_25230 [Pararhizobium antarcticum]
MKESAMILPPRPNVAAELRKAQCAEMLDQILDDLVSLSVASGWNEDELCTAMDSFLEKRRFTSKQRDVSRMKSN